MMLVEHSEQTYQAPCQQTHVLDIPMNLQPNLPHCFVARESIKIKLYSTQNTHLSNRTRPSLTFFTIKSINTFAINPGGNNIIDNEEQLSSESPSPSPKSKDQV